MQIIHYQSLKYLIQQPYTNMPKMYYMSVTLCTNFKRYYSKKKPQKQKLLKMPALKLSDTMPLFLKTCKPLLNDCEYSETKTLADEFVKCEGAELQKLLEEAAEKEENWLGWRWQKFAYFGYRQPVTCWSSPGMTLPFIKFKDMNDYFTYTSKLIMGMVKFKKRVDDGLMPIIKMGKLELDNSQFGVVYGTCRIPQPEYDKLDYYPNSKHAVVIYKNNFFKLPVYNKKGKILKASVLAEELKKIAAETTSIGKPIGILTTDNRDNWAEAYCELTKNKCNSEALKTIQSSLFTVSLDQTVAINDKNLYNPFSHQTIHGGGSEQNSGNRWMDKTIQLVVNPNGMSGLTYEHSPAEGQPVALMIEYVSSILSKAAEFEDGASDNYQPAMKLNFRPPFDCLDEYIKTASKNVDALAKDLDMNILHYKCHGKEFLKKQKLSPDSYLQTVFQYAFYKLHKFAAAQYESAHLRIYYNGRTETIRSCSSESLAFSHIMLDPSAKDDARVNVLKHAVNSHRKYTNLALQGRGVDRHLLGLKLMAIENEKPIPKFFSSPGYVKSSYFRVSTSQVATNNAAFMCYASPLPDGYGVCYNPRKNDMFFSVSCWHSAEGTSSKKFSAAISDALDQMHDMLLKVE